MFAGIVLAVVAVVYGASAGKNVQAKAKAVAEQAEIAPVGEALVAGGIAAERIKFRKPVSTLGTGRPEEERRVEIRVQ